MPDIRKLLIIHPVRQLHADGIAALLQILGDVIGHVERILVIARPGGIQHMVAHFGTVEKHLVITESADADLGRLHRFGNLEYPPKHRAVARSQAIIRFCFRDFPPWFHAVCAQHLGGLPLSDRLTLLVCGQPGCVRDEFYRSSLFRNDLHFANDPSGIAPVFSRDFQDVVANFKSFRQINGGRAFPVIRFPELIAIYCQRKRIIAGEGNRC